jgi:hypothetical protein
LGVCPITLEFAVTWPRDVEIDYILLTRLLWDVYRDIPSLKHDKSVRFQLNWLAIDGDLSSCVLVYYIHARDPLSSVVRTMTAVDMLLIV